MSLQTDDGRLKCLPHPGERGSCEQYGLTLGQASERGRLYREIFFVCRNCGREGETIRREIAVDSLPYTLSVRGLMKWCWGAAAVVVPLLLWMRWWWGAAGVGFWLLASPGYVWWENRKYISEPPDRCFPRADAPGRFPVPEPTAGLSDETIVGRVVGPDALGWPRATGPCCDDPDWIPASDVKDQDRVPCRACGHGVMVVSERSIH